jgi:hypothetical protein
MEIPTQPTNVEIKHEQIGARPRRRIDRNGVVLYSGPSQIDGSGPIVAIATGMKRPSCNSKTLCRALHKVFYAERPTMPS